MEQTQLEQQQQTLQAAANPEQIAERAYEIFLSRGGEHGRDQEDLFQVERELRSGQRNTQTSSLRRRRESSEHFVFLLALRTVVAPGLTCVVGFMAVHSRLLAYR